MSTGTMTASYGAAPIGNCGCGGTVAPVSYEGAYMDGGYSQGTIVEGCVGEGCGGNTIYESSDAVIDSTDTSTPVEAPVVQGEDKEA